MILKMKMFYTGTQNSQKLSDQSKSHYIHKSLILLTKLRVKALISTGYHEIDRLYRYTEMLMLTSARSLT